MEWLLLAIVALAFSPFAFAAEEIANGETHDHVAAPAAEKNRAENAQLLKYLSDLTIRAAAGDPKAETELGVCYVAGDYGIPMDWDYAYYLFSSAAAQRAPFAEYGLYEMYKDDTNPRNKGEALFWCQRAADDDCPMANEQLGYAYENGLLDLCVGAKKARVLYRKAALADLSSAMVRLARCYDSGIGGAIDEQSALAWALHAAETGDIDGELACAYLYSKDLGFQKPKLDLAWIWTSIANLDGLKTDEQRKTSASLRRSLDSKLSPDQQANDDHLAARYNELIRAGVPIARPDLTEHTEVRNAKPGESNKFEFSDSKCVLPVFVNGKGPFRFAFDTGCSFSYIDAALSKSLHLRPLGIRVCAGETATRESFVEAEYTVFQNSVRNGLLREISLKSLSGDSGRQIDGIIGYDLISSGVVEIDYQNQTIRFFDSNSYVHDPSLGAEIPFRLSFGVPVIRASICGLPGNPIPVDLIVDTGSDAPVDLGPNFSRNHPLTTLVSKAFQVESETIGRTLPGLKGRLQSLSLGPYLIKRPKVEYDNLVEARDGEMGALGAEELRRFKVILDYKHKRMFLEPNANLEKQIPGHWIGCEIDLASPRSHLLRIEKVYPNSPASKAGLRAGDIMLKAGGKSAQELLAAEDEPAEFVDFASLSPDPEIAGKVKRRGRIVPFKLTPEQF